MSLWTTETFLESKLIIPEISSNQLGEDHILKHFAQDARDCYGSVRFTVIGIFSFLGDRSDDSFQETFWYKTPGDAHLEDKLKVGIETFR